MAVTAAMTWIRGDAYSITDTIRTTAGVAVNITGFTFDFVVRQTQLGTVLLALESGSGIAITTAASGILTISVTATQTESLAAGDYFYALRKTNSGSEATLTMGKLTVVDSAAVPAP